MNSQSYLQSLASQFSLTYVPGLNIVKTRKDTSAVGSAVGTMRGYVVAVSDVRAPKQKFLCVMIRFPVIGETSLLKQAAEALPGIKTFVASKKLTIANDGVGVSWQYALRRPSQQEVVALIENLLSVVVGFAAPFKGRCEDCGKTAQATLTAMNGVPGYHCAECQARIAGEDECRAREYESREKTLPKALLFSTAAAAICAVAEAAALYFANGKDGVDLRLWVVATLFVGIVVGKVYALSVGRIDKWPDGIRAGLITVVANVAADAAFSTLVTCKLLHVAPQASVFLSTLLLWPVIRFRRSILLLVTFGELASGLVAGEVVMKDRPKFVRVFEPILPPDLAGMATVQN
jgi:hypothetical protein